MKAPASLLSTVVTTPVAVLVAVIDTPGNIAPDLSETVPLTVAYVDWPNACADTKTNAITNTNSLRMVPPPGIVPT